MESRVPLTLLLFFLWLLLSNSSYGTETDILCLQTLQESLSDPDGSLKYTWNFDNTTDGFICRFNGVECWHPNENKVLNLRLSDMGLRGQFPLGLEYCTSLSGLDLSNNNLSGPIPADISKRIPFVVNLDLSYNSFSGGIPISLSICTYLNILNLQHNQLSGRMPGKLMLLTRLTSINVADNQLSGPIPSFNFTLSPESFANNPGLCDGPLATCRAPSKSSNVGIIIGVTIGGVVTTILAGIVFFSFFA